MTLLTSFTVYDWLKESGYRCGSPVSDALHAGLKAIRVRNPSENQMQEMVVLMSDEVGEL